MKLLVYILKDYRRVEDLILAMVEMGITGATCVDGRGMGQLIGEMPIFAALRGLFPGSAVDSHVVFAAVPADKAHSALALMTRITGDATAAGAGVAFMVPLEGWVGIAPEIT
ncbi:MAG: hypothetical protein ACE366_09040 [Bradymonadia bacterium]